MLSQSISGNPSNPTSLTHHQLQVTAIAHGNISLPVNQSVFDALAAQFPDRRKIALKLFKVQFHIAEVVECNVNGVKGYKKLDQNRLNVIITQSFLHFPIVNAEDWEKEEKKIYQEINL